MRLLTFSWRGATLFHTSRQLGSRKGLYFLQAKKNSCSTDIACTAGVF